VRVEIDGETSPQNKQQLSEEISVGDLPKEKQQGLRHDAKCPNCGLINPAGTITCDCGYDFTLGFLVCKAEKFEVNLGIWGTIANFFNPIMILALIFTGPPGWILIWLHATACNKMRARSEELAKQARTLADNGRKDEALSILKSIEQNFRPEWRPKQWASLYTALSKK
jgi:hypothetical protein